MSTKPAVQSMPREQAPAQYQEQNERRYRNQVDEELLQKFDRRSNLVLGRGKSLVLSSSGGVQFALSLSDAGIIVVTDVATGDVTTVTLEWSALANRPTNLVALTGSEGIVTINNTAAGITGQGALATLSAVTWATQVTGVGRPEDYATYSQVYRQDSAPSSPNTNDIWVVTTGGGATPIAVRAWNGSAWVTGADITSINTAAAITGQGWGATASQPQADNSIVDARVSGMVGLLTANSFFDHPSTSPGLPYGWTDWQNGAQLITQAKPNGHAGFCMYADATSLGVGAKLGCRQEVRGLTASTRYVVSATVYRNTGSYKAAGLYVEYYTAAGAYISNALFPFGSSANTDGQTSNTHNGPVRFEMPLTLPGTADRVLIYAMTAWDGFGALDDPLSLFWYECSLIPQSLIAELRADRTINNTAAAIVGQGALATLNTIPAADKTVTKQNLDLDIDTSGTTWIVGPTFDMTVGATGYLSCPLASLYAGVGMTISAGTTFNGNWRITEATQAAPSTKTVVWSGTFTADSSPDVNDFVSPLTPILATKTGACRYTLEVQRASGTNDVTNLASFPSLTWTPSG